MNGVCSAFSSHAAVQGRRRGESGPLWPHTLVCPPSSHQIISVPRTRSTLFFITCLFISKSPPLHSVPASRAPPCRLCGRGGDDGRVKYTRRQTLSRFALLHSHATLLLSALSVKLSDLFWAPARLFSANTPTFPHHCAAPEAKQTEKLTLDSIRSAHTCVLTAV